MLLKSWEKISFNQDPWKHRGSWTQKGDSHLEFMLWSPFLTPQWFYLWICVLCMTSHRTMVPAQRCCLPPPHLPGMGSRPPVPWPHQEAPVASAPGGLVQVQGRLSVGRAHLTHLVARLRSGCLWRSVFSPPVSPCLRERDIRTANKKNTMGGWEREVTKERRKATFLLFENFQCVLSPTNYAAIPGFNLETAWEARTYLYLKSSTLNITKDKKSKSSSYWLIV